VLESFVESLAMPIFQTKGNLSQNLSIIFQHQNTNEPLAGKNIFLVIFFFCRQLFRLFFEDGLFVVAMG
jgi:hypothetical protein